MLSITTGHVQAVLTSAIARPSHPPRCGHGHLVGSLLDRPRPCRHQHLVGLVRVVPALGSGGAPSRPPRRHAQTPPRPVPPPRKWPLVPQAMLCMLTSTQIGPAPGPLPPSPPPRRAAACGDRIVNTICSGCKSILFDRDQRVTTTLCVLLSNQHFTS